LSGYQALRLFDPSMMVHFRKRIGPDLIKVCNAMTKANGIAMIQDLLAASQEDGKGSEEEEQFGAMEAELRVRPETLEPGSNWGTLILDAMCVPDAIPYPSDLRLLNVGEAFSAGVARDATEAIADPAGDNA
jgi:IS5 family transposase